MGVRANGREGEGARGRMGASRGVQPNAQGRGRECGRGRQALRAFHRVAERLSALGWGGARGRGGECGVRCTQPILFLHPFEPDRPTYTTARGRYGGGMQAWGFLVEPAGRVIFATAGEIAAMSR